MILIKKLKIQNFKIYKEQEFNFDNYRFILISGGNGFGKTTIIDAIEWCLTGNIGRINYNYNKRNTSKNEKIRVDNKKGIIKNTYCNNRDKIKVELTLDIDGREVVIYREQTEDDLNLQTELQFVNEVPSDIKSSIIKFSNDDLFYPYHVCDTFKSFQFLSTKRKDLKEQFDHFVKPYTKADNVKSILNLYSSNLENNKDDLERQKSELFSKIEKQKEIIETLKSEVEITEYPKNKFCSDEDINIADSNNLVNINSQKRKIEKCGYNRINLKLDNIIEFYEAKKKIKTFNELLELSKEIEDDIRITIERSYYDDTLLKNTNDKIKDHTDVINEVENANRSTDVDIEKVLGQYKDKEKEIKTQYNDIKKLENLITTREEQIATREKGNSIITALSNLVTDKKSLLEYKKEGYNSCPLCGSEDNFKDIEKIEEIAVEAELYLDKSNSDLAKFKNKVKELKENCSEKFKQLKTDIIQQANKQLGKYKKEKEEFTKYNKKTKDFFEKLLETTIKIDKHCIYNIKRSRKELDIIILKKDTIDTDLREVINISNSLELDIELEEPNLIKLNKLKSEIEVLSDESIELFQFTYKDFNRKLVYLNQLINNHKMNEKMKELDKFNNNYKKTTSKIKMNEKYIELSKEHFDKISKILNQLEDSELKSVGQYLYKIFIKIIKNTNKITEFKLETDDRVREERGAVFTDDKGNNIMNILSQGQLGVFMISYFIANMFKRKEETDFKSYFVDDITSALDDMNVLSFIEMIKYQLDRENGVINQFFFSTADEDIEKNFINKMESFNIEWLNYKFSSYSKYNVNCKNEF